MEVVVVATAFTISIPAAELVRALSLSPPHYPSSRGSEDCESGRTAQAEVTLTLTLALEQKLTLALALVLALT